MPNKQRHFHKQISTKNILKNRSIKFVSNIKKDSGIKNVKYTNQAEFFAFMEKEYKSTYSFRAVGLAEYSKSSRSINYQLLIYIFLFLYFSLLVLAPNIFLKIHQYICITSFVFRCIITGYYRTLVEVSYRNHLTKLLPMYTILVPLYQELPFSIIESIESIHYPKHRLDVKLVTEEDDITLNRILLLCKLPSYYHLVKTPKSYPRTKPKALNYAIHYALGDYVVVFDAEDRPDPDQLYKALAEFRVVSKDYICLQAKLLFYNYSENILTLLFQVEYYLLFSVWLKFLSQYDLPIPLGGTSNHFKRKALEKLGLWDSYNVTEDADLGIRIYLMGYKTKLLSSYTYEEAPITIFAWIHQRTRWFKGFIQTIFIFFKSMFYSKNTTIKQNLLIIYFLLVPLIIYIGNLVCVILILALGKNLLGLLVTGFILNAGINQYANYLCIKSSYLSNISKYQKFFLVIIIPFYFCLHSIAIILAIVDLIFRPFYWSKTSHMVSKFSQKYNLKISNDIVKNLSIKDIK